MFALGASSSLQKGFFYAKGIYNFEKFISL
jgi:hypothetical protein